MSKVHGRDASLYSDIASTTIAGQLESRMKELERNIAVARQFIKLADECYGQVKHEWELLQQDARPRPTRAVPEFSQSSPSLEQSEQDFFEEISTFKEKKPHPSRNKTGKVSGPTTPHTPSLGAKPETPKRKDNEASSENKASETPQKESRSSRHKKGKTQGSKE